MAYKVPGVTVRNQFEPLANPGAFGNRLLAVLGLVDTSTITNFPSFVQEMQMTPSFAQIQFVRPYPVLGTITAKDRIISTKQGGVSYAGCTSETETGITLGYVAATRGTTPDTSDIVTSTVFGYDPGNVGVYVIDALGNEYTETTDYTLTFADNAGYQQVTIDWSPRGVEPAAGTAYYVVFANGALAGTYDYYYFEYTDEEDVTLTMIWRDSVTVPLERSIYYVTIRKEFPYEAGIYTNPDQALQDFGTMLTADNTAVSSQLSYASYLVFGERAPAVMLVPYDVSTKTFQQALDELLTYEEPTIITAVDNSDPSIAGTNARLIAAHVSDASSDTHKKYRIGLVAPHYTSNYVNNYTAAAQTLHTRRMTIVAPSQTTFSVTGTDGLTRDITTTQYAAIVLGAMMTRSDYDVATSMTRKASRTITKLTPKWDDAFMNLIASPGVTLFSKLHGNIVVRDDITTEPETIMTAEPYITCIADDIAKSAIILLDASLIGQKLIVPAMLNAVNARITSMLSGKQAAGIITAFGRPIIAVDPTDPRKINVTVPIQPIFAAKYIDITFSYVAQL